MLPSLHKIVRADESKNSDRRKPLYVYFYQLIKDLIAENELPAQTLLPPTRKLSEQLGVSRSTMIKAYELLRLEGFIVSTAGSGHEVRSLSNDTRPKRPDHQTNYPALSKLGKSFEDKGDWLNSTNDKSIAFRPGLPPLDVFPVNTWKNLSNLYWKNIHLSGLSYSPAAGIETLRQNIANYLNLTRGVKCDPEQLFIVSGSLQSLYLIGTCMLDKGDEIVIENPTFPNVKSIFNGLMAQVQGIDIDDEGLSINQLRELKSKPKLIHVTPSCQYPLGVRMSVNRRQELLDYANGAGALIIENDYEHNINNYKNPCPSVFELDEDQRTVFLGTFNRLLHPSLRIGYMVVPRPLVKPLEMMLKHSHRFVPTYTQLVLNQFIEKKHLYKHLQNISRITDERRAVFSSYFIDLFSDTPLSLRPISTPGLQLLLDVEGLNDRKLVDQFLKHNIVTHSLNKCYVNPSNCQGLIVGFSPIRIPSLKSKLQKMSQIYQHAMA